ncbi:hypothetical protein ElyMa_005273300 [Elysia marginata]|uniref:Uncharacterized protein n=1 Tax=Elysia marginata TaxID=1093978 RepID=A0AAV4JZN5_9GAST|nr:hypothetical protein ElyMa_005273300 [Elysia marginata]
MTTTRQPHITMLANATSRLTCISSFDEDSDGESPEPSPDDCDSPCGSLRSNGQKGAQSAKRNAEEVVCPKLWRRFRSEPLAATVL